MKNKFFFNSFFFVLLLHTKHENEWNMFVFLAFLLCHPSLQYLLPSFGFPPLNASHMKVCCYETKRTEIHVVFHPAG